mmetsp:Transcript_15983/g.24008  ORF Transcript_15983/g.24008 Transcript_15983/m.24008 type:complete len:110 (+) Transcript_15983:2190-2519(+)
MHKRHSTSREKTFCRLINHIHDLTNIHSIESQQRQKQQFNKIVRACNSNEIKATNKISKVAVQSYQIRFVRSFAFKFLFLFILFLRELIMFLLTEAIIFSITALFSTKF